MNLSEDGVLVIETNRQRLMLFARSEKDLEKMLAVFTTYSKRHAHLPFKRMEHGVFLYTNIT